MNRIFFASVLSLFFLILLLLDNHARGQTKVNSENGVSLPPSVPPGGEIFTLVVFAEVDFTGSSGHATCRPGGGIVDNDVWRAGKLPTDADTYLDDMRLAKPQGYVTDYYAAMSFNRHFLLGDFVVMNDPTKQDEIITIPCGDLPAGRSKAGTARLVFDALDANGTIRTAKGHTLGDFDRWDLPGGSSGIAKTMMPNGKIDLVVILWRNYDPGSNTEKNASGFGFGAALTSLTINSTNNGTITIDNLASFSAFSSGLGGYLIFIGEHFHTLFGGNDWHTGSGAGTHTFMAPQGSFSITAQSFSAAIVVSGWDRNHLRWRNPDKTYLISALNENLKEVKADITINSHPTGGTFVLRDFVRTGDAIRIRLPHFNWTTLGDRKNQYLWLENHQRQSRRFDVNGAGFDVTEDPRHVCHKKWAKGIYAYIQVGKDIKQDTNRANVYPDTCISETGICSDNQARHPNALASWLFPLSAEGNFDFFYRLDHISRDNEFCQFNNISLPIERAASLPNPFTGYSDLFFSVPDADMLDAINPLNNTATFLPSGNGILDSVTFLQDVTRLDGQTPPMPEVADTRAILSDFRDGNVFLELPEAGDDEDAFRCGTEGCGTGKTILSMGTNPAPVPVYTHKARGNFSGPNNSPLGTFENRRIRLNGLSIEILEEAIEVPTSGDPDTGAVKIRVRWDNFLVENPVRWTGDIVLTDDSNDPLNRQSQINLASFQALVLDQGLSPTLYRCVGPPPPGVNCNQTPDGEFLFAGPTILTLEASTAMTIQDSANLIVRGGRKYNQGATLHIQDQADVVIEGKGSITIEDDSFLCIEQGANISLKDVASRIVLHIGAKKGINPDLGKPQPPCQELSSLSLTGSGDVLFLGTGDLDGDNDVDRDDLQRILGALNTDTGPNDPRDIDQDGRITILDARKLMVLCTRSRCATS